jgi:hypothetical protein
VDAGGFTTALATSSFTARLAAQASQLAGTNEFMFPISSTGGAKRRGLTMPGHDLALSACGVVAISLVKILSNASSTVLDST